MNAAPDYEKVLDDLIAERAELDRMINWVKLKLGRADSEPVTPTVKAGATIRFPRVAPDAFFRMTVAEGIKAFLKFTNKTPQTAREITEGLIAGGLAFKAKKPYQTVFPTLARMEEVVKVNDKWGLAEWYPSRRTATPEEAK